MEKQPLPAILLHSDLHRESGPFTFPPAPTGAAVAVFAGDVCSGDGGAAAVRAMSDLPTVYVAGNHEFWGGDYYERLAELEARAKEHGVHFLERRAVVIHGVRFLGATLWTDYGRGHPALMSYGLYGMFDHQAISAASWWTPANRTRFVKQFGEHALEKFDGKFNPLLALELHRKTRAWLKRELAKPFDGPTVVVTHHAPTYDSLRRAGVQEHALDRSMWVRRMKDDLGLAKVGSYASELLPDLHYDLQRANVRLWAHGHLHQAMHFGAGGIAVAANPRGRVRQPLTRENADRAGLFGLRYSDADIERSQQAHRANPEQGDGFGYEKTRTFDLTDTGYTVIADQHPVALGDIAKVLAQLKALRSFARSKRAAVADLAGHRADTLWQSALDVVRKFADNMARQLVGPGASRQLDWLLRDCLLTSDWREFAGMENFGDYEGILLWRRIDAERAPEQRELFATQAGRYTAQNHLAHIEKSVGKLAKALRRAPAACERLQAKRRRVFA
jgi:hypothetical protein